MYKIKANNNLAREVEDVEDFIMKMRYGIMGIG